MSSRATSGEPVEALLCASANPHKVREIESLLAGAVELVSRPVGIPDVDETADSLLGNARLKASTCVRSPLNLRRLPAIADDTGLFVRALPHDLGVRTARYASDRAEHRLVPDAANRRKLLDALDRAGCAEPQQRRAQFVTVVVVCFVDGTEIVAEGRCDGHIASAERGSGGFGFDPLFVPDLDSGDLGSVTFAEMGASEKNVVSHRGRAFRQLASALSLS